MSSSPRRCGFGGSGADGAELGPEIRGGKVRVGRILAPQLSAGTIGPAPAAPPPPPLTEPLPAAAAAEVGPGSTLRTGTQGSGRSCLPTRVHPPAYPATRLPFLFAPRPGLRWEGVGGGRAAAVRGGGKGEQRKQGEDCPRREARSSCSRKSPPSFPPRKRGDGGSSCERKRCFSSATRCSEPPATSRRRQRRRGGRWVNKRPQSLAEQTAGPAPSRRAGIKGRAHRRRITARLPPGPPRVCLPAPGLWGDLRQLLSPWRQFYWSSGPQRPCGARRPSSTKVELSPHFPVAAQVFRP